MASSFGDEMAENFETVSLSNQIATRINDMGREVLGNLKAILKKYGFSSLALDKCFAKIEPETALQNLQWTWINLYQKSSDSHHIDFSTVKQSDMLSKNKFESNINML